MANFTPIGVEAVIKNEQGFMHGMGLMQGAIAGVTAAAANAAIQGVAQLTKAVAGLAVGTVESAISVESAFAGVIKTTDGLIDESGQLTQAGAEIRQEFRDLAKEVPLGVEELMAVGEIGGQLGIARDDLISFTETIVAMGESTNLTREEAATQFAQIANIMGTTKEEGSEAFSKLGSTIVALGNNFATTERDISAFAQRIAGAGEIAGLTEADVLGIGAAMASVGVQAEAGGTAVQKVLLGINESVLSGGDQLEIYAATAGLTADEFAKLWEDDAGAGFDAFVKGLGRAGDDALGILDALELKDQRLTRAFLSLANAGDLITESMGMASDAWIENTALTTEANQRYMTMESQIAMVKNQVRDFGITIGEALMPFLSNALEIIKPFIQQLGERLPDLLNTYVIPTIQKVVGFIEGFSFVLQDLLSGVLGTDYPWEDVFPPWLADLIYGLTEQFGNFGTFWQEYGPEIQRIAGELLAEFISAAQYAASELLPFLAEQFAKVSAWFVENGPLIVETGQVILDFWRDHVAPTLDNVFEIIKLTFGGMIDAILKSAKIFMLLLTGDWEKAWEEIKLLFATMGLTLLRIWDEFLEGVLNALGSTTAEFQAMWRANWEMAHTILVTLWARIKETFAQFVKDTIEAGEGIIEGFVEGVKRRAQRLIDSVVKAIKDAIAAAKAAAGIKSPSAVFFGLGEAMGEGLAMGLASMAPTIQAVAGGTVAAATATASAPMTAVTNYNSFSFETTINSDMDAAVFQAQTVRAVEGALRVGA